MECNTILKEKVDEWLAWDKNEASLAEISRLQAQGDEATLSKLLLSRMEFGTAGLRGCMGPGYSQMNDLVIIQTSQGLAAYVKSSQEKAQEMGVVIGYDGRHNSKRFAELTAAAFLSQGLPVYLYSAVCPTPFVPFAVSLFGCACGVMVTASHNPKQDNGYKVYWHNGAQIISPHDKNIQASILSHLAPGPNAWQISGLKVQDPLARVMEEYYSVIRADVLDQAVNANATTKITYTAMHGVGHRYMVEAFKTAGFKPFVSVVEQQEPDPEFPTVVFPNPEEGKSALDLALRTADREGCTLILANDPDADRLAAAEKGPGGAWHVFSGNELGALLGWWVLHSYRVKHPDTDLGTLYMLASTVSSKLLRAMAKKEGFNFVETLTGFKWMGNKACELSAEGGTVLFAFEEAIGFMCGTAVLDKDGVSAAVRAAELVAHLEIKGLTLAQKLQEIYAEYGYHMSLNSYFLCHEPPVIKKMFERLRNFNGSPNTYPSSLLDGRYPVTSVRDLTTGHDSMQPDGHAVLPCSASSQMLTLSFENGLVATLRTSGTEPKVKYYTELCAAPGNKDQEALHATLQEMVDAIVKEWFQPELNGLQARTG